MKRKTWFASVFLGGMFLSGCATNGQFVRLPDQGMQVEDASKARIYVLRPAGIFGSAISMVVKDGDQAIGNTKGGGRYLSWEREPGFVNITSKAENEAQASFPVEAGKRYYILQRIQMGFWMARNSLDLLGEAEGEKYLSMCKPASQRQ